MKQDSIKKRKKILQNLQNREAVIENLRQASKDQSHQLYQEKHKKQEELTEEIKINLIHNEEMQELYREELSEKINDKSNTKLIKQFIITLIKYH